MFTVVMNYETSLHEYIKREIKENLTARELGNYLTELSKKYVLLFDTVRDVIEAVGCTMHFTATERM